MLSSTVPAHENKPLGILHRICRMPRIPGLLQISRILRIPRILRKRWWQLLLGPHLPTRARGPG